MSGRRRLEALEVAYWRRAAEAAAAPAGFTGEAVLEQCIRFLTLPPDQQRAECPQFTEAERAEMCTWLPALRRARWGRP